MFISLSDYENFNAEKFLRKREDRLREKQKLEEKLRSLSSLPSVNNETGIRGSDISDTTAARAEQELSIINQIDMIEECEMAYDYAMERLEPDEREVIKGLFEPQMPIWKFRHEWSRRHFMGDTMFYRERGRILNKFGEIIETDFELK